MQTTASERNAALDYLRILACWMVVTFHVLGGNLAFLSVESAAWKVSVYYDLLLRTSVPLFFMMSGRLFLSRDRMPSMKMLFTKYILRYSVMWLAWNVFYRMTSIGLHNWVSAGWDVRSFVGIVCTEPKYHLWYLKELVWIYLLVPVLWCAAKNENGKYLGWACALFLLCSVGWNTVLRVSPDEKKWMTMVNGFVKTPAEYAGYFLLGYYLSRKDFSRVCRWLVLAAFAAVVAAGGWMQIAATAETGRSWLVFSNYLTLPVCAGATLLYIFATGYPTRHAPVHGKLLQKLSSYTLFVYLAHPFVLEKMEAWSFARQGMLPEALRVPLVGVVAFVISVVGAAIFHCIPFLRKRLY